MNTFILMALGLTCLHGRAENIRQPARVTFWQQGEDVTWKKCAQGWSIKDVYLMNPSGRDGGKPSWLTVEIMNSAGVRKRFNITIEQASLRGHSLLDVHTRLKHGRWESIAAFQFEEDGTTLRDFMLQYDCEIRFQPEVTQPTTPPT